MTTLATIDDYEARCGTVPSGDVDLVETLLDDASSLILTAVSGSDSEWVVGDENPPREVVMVCVASARRARTHDGAPVAREQLGQYSVTYRDDVPYEIWLTKEEVRQVRKAAGLTSARTVTLESPYSGPASLSRMDFLNEHGELET